MTKLERNLYALGSELRETITDQALQIRDLRRKLGEMRCRCQQAENLEAKRKATAQRAVAILTHKVDEFLPRKDYGLLAAATDSPPVEGEVGRLFGFRVILEAV